VAKLVLFGAGDIARLARVYFESDSDHQVVAFTVDRAYLSGDSFEGLPLVPFDEVTTQYPPGDYGMFVALSYAKMNRVRAEKYEQAKARGYRLATYVSSRCAFLTAIRPGENCFILEGTTIQPFVRIGNNVTLWSGSNIGHDSIVEDHCFISSHVVASGHVTIGAACFLGINATVRNSITLGARTLVGAGATIMKNTPEDSVYLGPRSEPLGRSSGEMNL
jgi:sugar O-acyltransferase (sialic acid O-acetyltransferase NeuD family)